MMIMPKVHLQQDLLYGVFICGLTLDAYLGMHL